MGQNTRQLLQLILIVAVFTAIVIWAAPLPLSAIVVTIRIVAPLASLGMAYVVYRVWRSPDRLPDKLQEIARRYFERKGLCFAPRFEVQDGRALLCIYFQNRHEREVYATLAVQPGMRSFRLTRYRLSSVSVSVGCPGGAFGVARVPIPIPAGLQGKQIRFEVGADVEYAGRRGKLLRMHGGRRTSCTSNLHQGYQFLNALGGVLLGGIIREQSPAKLLMILPTNVADTLPESGAPRVELLWWPDMANESSPPPTKLAA
ncbi:MAG TPA: hypothetical protein VH370_04890 [Humisphaera sp.]|nr:hypothetical protein [Humisphaera sp.]